ncbi:glycosyltransferase family 2 protein [Aureimonas glaciei]|uniref:Glycosyl transferase family A n=1 Tax=Aureimonas glaciei TaxID=1776957 RepID=A0A916XZD3_9HYPH|nr:glycosyltransferase family 2 protein [Aureimonas glaciei]GGD24044.1 glycosyl transferase family A [Aureimonas glaciei]
MDSVSVVIAAMNARDTIGRAVRSALAEAEVAEVVVVDDGSRDDTAATARAADDGSGRLAVLELGKNRGPSAARNHAIAHSQAPLIAILDADDFLLPGRFKPMLAEDDWDFVADNILFVDAAWPALDSIEAPRFAPEPRFLDLAGFIEGNISRRGKERGEIGFLKPVMRRRFLAEHGLSYREEMRLGEDYDLYARALICGARYKILHSVGYGAVVRANSLSGRHRTVDLHCLADADAAMLADPQLTGRARRLVAEHEAHVRGRFELRRFLDQKSERGLAQAGLAALARPAALPAVVLGIARDKFDALQRRGAGSGPAAPLPPRTLMPGRAA